MIQTSRQSTVNKIEMRMMMIVVLVMMVIMKKNSLLQ